MNKKEHINQILELVDRSRMPKSRLVDFSVLRTLLNENLPEQLIIADVVLPKGTLCDETESNRKNSSIATYTKNSKPEDYA